MSKLGFIVPHYNISGGMHVIFRHASYLANNNFDIYFISSHKPNRVIEWFPEIMPLVTFIDFTEVLDHNFDICFASSWETVYRVAKIQAIHYAYIVQAPEFEFIPRENPIKRDLAVNTYICGIKIITIASWLQQFLLSQYGVKSFLVKNGINKEAYAPIGRRNVSDINFLVEGSITDTRKNVPQTVKLLQELGVKHIFLLTSSNINYYPGVERVFSKIPIDKVSSIYQQCDVLVKLSTVEGMFGPPLEMFHCGGTAITFAVPGHEEYMIHNYNSLIAPIGDFEMVKDFVRLILTNTVLLQKLKQNALATANLWRDWDKSSEEFANVVKKILVENPSNQTQLLVNLELVTHLYEGASRLNLINIFQVLLLGGIRKLKNKFYILRYRYFKI